MSVNNGVAVYFSFSFRGFLTVRLDLRYMSTRARGDKNYNLKCSALLYDCMNDVIVVTV